jgi:hypothetical protein
LEITILVANYCRLPALVALLLQKIFDERLHDQVCSERFVAGNLSFGKQIARMKVNQLERRSKMEDTSLFK